MNDVITQEELEKLNKIVGNTLLLLGDKDTYLLYCKLLGSYGYYRDKVYELDWHIDYLINKD